MSLFNWIGLAPGMGVVSIDVIHLVSLGHIHYEEDKGETT